MVKGYVLLIVNPAFTKEVLESLKDFSELAEFHEVMGAFDIVVEIEVEQRDEVSLIASKIRDINGVESTTSVVSLPK